MSGRNRAARQAGVSLVEALVALAVMAFGMLALVGVQATLRQNADIAKQRSEAVRIAQRDIESWRAFAVLQAGAGELSFGNLQDGTAVYDDGVEDVELNATYTITRSVSPDTGTTPPFPLTKTLVVDVSWVDRNDQPQSVRLSTTVAGVAPELAGSLSMPPNGDPASRPGGRDRSIPRPARDYGGGFSDFVPPGQPGGDLVAWRFDNVTGVITFCTTSIASTVLLTSPSDLICGTTQGLLVSGFVRFATEPTQPTAAQAALPTSTAQTVSVSVRRTLPVPVADDQCFEDTPAASYVSYFCAVPISTDPLDPPPRWSGRSIVDGFSFTTNAADAGTDRYRVCRYTRLQGDPPAPSTVNAEHPLDYADVTTGLINQNFLVILAGNGTTAFTCPEDDTSTAIDTTTWHHPPEFPPPP